jgi:hypothetical protein
MQPWAHLWRRYRKLWTRSGCPSDKSDASFDSPFPSTPSAADPVASTSIAFIVYVTTVPIASTSPPADGLRRSFVDVVTMSGPPQRPPPVGAIAAGKPGHEPTRSSSSRASKKLEPKQASPSQLVEQDESTWAARPEPGASSVQNEPAREPFLETVEPVHEPVQRTICKHFKQ